MAKGPEKPEKEETEGPTRPFPLRLPAQTIAYLNEIRRCGVYGRTMTAVARAFIEAGIREAINKDYIKISVSDE